MGNHGYPGYQQPQPMMQIGENEATRNAFNAFVEANRGQINPTEILQRGLADGTISQQTYAFAQQLANRLGGFLVPRGMR